ncbi:MAG: hypothetical protein OJF49_000585 [Ktedonobacterales bacterium]|jgi:phosphatidylserine/phosphatidylglycerophosphate/cardiolipin synthase-like enzyme|nr:MAG: hypothetical protein OJF49_000585 [Ktedonobacterales bacterium]
MAGDSSTFSTGDLHVYFQSKRADVSGDLVAQLAEFIVATEHTLDCAIYDLRHPRILEALAHVVSSGKRLRLVYDGGHERTGGLSGDPKPSGTQQAIESAGLGQYATPVHEHGRHLMHDKFLIRDGQTVWTGSANFTVGGLELQDNNCLVIGSPQLAAAYTNTFEDLLQHDHRHEAKSSLSISAFATGEAAISPSFAPAAGEQIEDSIVAALQRAKRVRILAFLISDPGILVALARFAGDPSLDIRGVFDPHGMQDVLRYSRLGEDRFWFVHDPRFVAAPSHAYHPAGEQDFMHNKVFIIDDRLVFTGSYNFSENAEANDENFLSIESPTLAAAYVQYFDTLYAAYRGSNHAETTQHPGSEPTRPAEQTERLETHLAEVGRGPEAHVFILRSEGRVRGRDLQLASTRQQFRGETEVGRTEHFIVYTDGSPNGTASAQAVLAKAEADYSAVRAWFGGIDLPAGHEGDDQATPRTATPMQVLVDPQAGGAYHFGCDATDIYIDPQPQEAPGLMVAEMVEIFEAAINNGWQCGQTNGEGLSRVLAIELHSELASITSDTAQGWWANGHADYVNRNDADDRNQDANACGSLFLYYLHSQLGYSWQQIVAAGGANLGTCYTKLTGNSGADGFNDFVQRLSSLAQGGQLALPASGNPFPVGGATPPAPSTPPDVPVPATPSSGDPQVPVSVDGSHPVMMGVIFVVLALVIVFGALVALGIVHM